MSSNHDVGSSTGAAGHRWNEAHAYSDGGQYNHRLFCDCVRITHFSEFVCCVLSIRLYVNVSIDACDNVLNVHVLTVANSCTKSHVL